MSEKEMSLENTLNTLRYCSDSDNTCDGCVLYDAQDEACECANALRLAAVEHIEALQTEFAKKNSEIERLNFENLQMVASIKGLRAEAIKDFAEKAKESGVKNDKL